MTPLLSIYCLGRFEFYYQAGPQSKRQLLPKPPTAKAQSLLAYLAQRRDQPQPRARLVGMFWGDRPTRKARRSLSTALWQIRRCFPGGAGLDANAQTVQIRFPGDLRLDVEAFEACAARDDVASLETAVSLYQGDFLDGFYDDWIINDRYRLHTLYLGALARLMAHRESASDDETALETALRLLHQDSLREDAHRLAMRAYCRLGQRNAALEQYGRCRQIVQQELGAEPMAETVQLYQAILDGRWDIQPAQPPTPTGSLETTTRQPSGRHPLDVTAVMPLAGRDEELKYLRTHWQKAQAGQSSLLLVQGEAGVGKTHLVKAFADSLQRQGVRVLWGHCYEFERILPYQPIAEAIRALLPLLNPAELAGLPDWSLTAAARLAPEISDYLPDLALPSSPGPDREQARLFDGLTRFLTELSTHGALLIVLEDLHWASQSTLQLIHYLARRLADSPLLLLGTARSDAGERFHTLQTFQRPLIQAGLAHLLPLARLTPTAVETIVEQLSGAGEAIVPLARRLCRETEGNPFYLAEMIKTLFEAQILSLEAGIWRGDFDGISQGEIPLPAGVSAAILARVGRLNPDARALLEVTAVLGYEFDFDLLNAIWGRGREAVLEALDSLLRRRLIAEGAGDLGRDYAFTHHKIQEVVYADLPSRRRQYLHGRIGVGLETLYASHVETMAGEIAFHYQRAMPLDKTFAAKAAAYLRRAGEQAATQFAHAEAVNYFSRALDLIPEQDYAGRYDLLLARERAYNFQGERAAQAQDLDSLESLAPNLSVGRQTRIALCRATYAQKINDYPTAITAAQNAINLAGADQEQQAAAEGCMIWGQSLMRQGEYGPALSQFRQALTLAQGERPSKLKANILNNLGLAFYSLGDYAEAGGHYRQALQMFHDIGDPRGQSASLNNLGVLAEEQGGAVAAGDYYRRALRLHRQIGNRRGECLVLGNLGVIAAVQGAHNEARTYHEQSLHIADEIGHRLFAGNAHINLGNVCLNLGDYAGARKNLEQALDLHRQIGHRPGQSWGLTYLSLLSHCLGDNESALTYSQQALHMVQEIGDQLIQGYALTHLGHALAGLGRHKEAADAYQQATAVQRQLGQNHLAAESSAGLARALLAQGKLAQAMSRVEEILSYSDNHDLNGADEPFRVYLTCYRILRACDDSRAFAILTRANTLLQEQAARISDEAIRSAFLQNVPAHRELIAAFADI